MDDRRHDPIRTERPRAGDWPGCAREWLTGGGETGELIRSLDWSATPLGPRAAWPEGLRAVVGLLVANAFPMALLWGRDLVLVYNDAYRVIAGGKHPAALGRSTREVWPEVWHINEPIVAAVMDRGEAISLDDARFPVNRHGYDEDAWFTLCYSPVRIEGGAVGGTLVTLQETTAQVVERRRTRQALTESTALLRAISDTSTDVIFAKDREGRMRFANPAALALIGKPLDAVVGRTDAEFLDDPGAAREVMENDRRVMERGVAEELEERVPLPDGSERVWLSRKSPWRDPSGAVVGLLGISRDITDRKRADEALRASEERYRTLFTHMTEGFALGEILCDAGGAPSDFRLLEMNGAFERQSGLPRETTRGRSIRAVLPNIERSWIETYGSVALGGPPRRFESYNGDLGRWFDVYCFSPAPGRFAVLFTDVSERKRAEEALRESEERSRSVLENMAEGLVLFDASGNITYQNPASVRIHDRRLEGERRRLDQLVVHWAVRRYPEGDVVPPERWAIPRVLRGERVENERFFVDCVEDPSRSFVGIYNGSLVRDAGGRFLYGFLTIQEITDQARAEGALRRANETLQEADRRKDEFLGMLSHELRNPLAPIRNALYILDHAEPTGQQARRAKEIANRQLAHLARLVDDLLDVTRIARGKIELRRAELDLAALARRTAEDHRQLMQDRHVELALELPEAPVVVDGDETRLAQVLGNLLHNAAKFTPAGGRVTLSVAADARNAAIRVRDTGAGIDPEMMQAIFEPFTQAKQTLARSEGGLGLGLALVKGLVALHGGEVAVRSEGAGRGTEFALTLPLARPHRPVARATPGAPSAAGAEPRRVLVIDDNRDAADSLAQLVSMMGHEAEVAYDGYDGLARAADAMPDVVLCDIGLPGMDGYEVARQLRALASRDRVRLVAVSGYAQPEDVARALEAGFDVHVAKPPDPEALARTLAAPPGGAG